MHDRLPRGELRAGPRWCLGARIVAPLVLLPALCVLALGERGRHLLPRVRDWMNNNSWIISEAVIVLFIVLTAQNL
ncbi:hypothetical protein [Actinopolymorpha singaporensis]|uniref:hypothetical protein n=1 Tax=Actinopolymorpha singaporensis TaxID=117157 RepID=UPI0018D3A87E|nr:hypothetical protein [Actinopolymorpha singaporensis]